MGWFSKTPSWEETYAQNIYKAFVVADEIGELTPEALRIPTAALERYSDKARIQREAMCFVALMSSAGPETNLRPVMMAFSKLLTKNMATRGIQVDIDQFADASVQDVGEMFAEPFKWSQGWLAEFRNDPKDNYMVVMFADHCQRQFNAYKHAIEETNRKTR
jgi:hypothetical protein